MIPAPTNLKDTTAPKSDAEIQGDVMSELRYEPAVCVTDIGVVVKDGIVTLSGVTASHGEKWHAIRAAKRVAGVKGLADEVNVVLSEQHRRTDTDIATAAVHQLEWSTSIPKDAMTVTVRDGWITLDGELEWWYQRIAAEDVLKDMAGVKGIRNLVTIRPLLIAEDIASAIRSAFDRHAMLDARKIEVETEGSRVILSGRVANSTEREEAERVAWAAPGVHAVDNRIRLEWGWFV
jgi:osmotically-inducible protein OsmY